IPSLHRYYLPEDSSEWEFIFITVFGQEAENCFELIRNKVGQVIHLELHSAPVMHIFNLLEKAAKNELQDAYESSSDAYTFLMKLNRTIMNADNQSWPESVQKAAT